ncbi:uncharacterized protein DUF2530 [Halopolyspora algeriensis]|uniref:Uncharacterized protein DUF2530 n=2 Tax=Halopolyspora algeriensis TaxID=1500506 RepID=A0A368VRH5_9ACTN|nr:DUF2530 domain-containing protein [Halopolyspora algeriensis]RCW43615.1 uncharacterized protein DUF2530 [Halopolyspora algeriensis]TQM47600.1 uncharacterized protein DUF2530 [Halopolyspora algeriensis]
MQHVPSLPRKLADPTPVVLTGTLLWFTACLVFGITSGLSGGVDIRFWTCLIGGILGSLGYGVFRWQRSAARRGSRGAWQGLSGLDG